ncbi:MAG: hypothetical protein JNK11_17705 [Alphaproteobacteria bacterium]|nr:hypothetical protein [Alphaproteobacteria bacterium]
MTLYRIHVTGAAGAGVTTLGRALAGRLVHPHFDTDDFFWLPTDPPYQAKRPVPDRLRLMRELFLGRADWVLSGSLDSWGEELLPLFGIVVFLRVPTDVRIARLREREARHFGAHAIAPGGSRHAEMEDFLDWAAHYDDGGREGRNLARHEAWLARLPCPQLQLDGTVPMTELVEAVVRGLSR